jgi:TatD DNase family protein
MLGIHPWRAVTARSGWEDRLAAQLLRNRAGLGECGLDFARRPVDREAQVRIFRSHLRLAARHRRPVAIHCVRAWGALRTLLAEEGLPPAGAMVHAFGGSAETARELQDLGLHLSFSTRLGEPGAGRITAALGAVRDDRLLLESDAPGPDGAEPAALPALAEAVARLRGCAADYLTQLTHRNAERLFEEVLA